VGGAGDEKIVLFLDKNIDSDRLEILLMKIKIACLSLAALFLVTSVSVSATDSTSSATDSVKRFPKVSSPSAQKSPKVTPSEGKGRSCEVKEVVIKKRMVNLLRMATNMLDKFDSITARVQNYYTSKLVPQGKTLANYDTLVSGINSKKDGVKAAIANAEADSAGFNCDVDKPKDLFNKFHQDMQKVIRSLKEYRTSVRNLIVAVHGLVGKKGGVSPSSTPLGTLAPTATVMPAPTATPNNL